MREAWRTAALGFGAGLVGAAVGVAGLGAGPGVPGEVRARRVVIEDEKGRDRIVLRTDPDGTAAVDVDDAAGNTRFTAGVTPQENPVVLLNDARNATHLSLGLSPRGDAPIVRLTGASESRYLRLSVVPAGASVKLQGAAGAKFLDAP